MRPVVAPWTVDNQVRTVTEGAEASVLTGLFAEGLVAVVVDDARNVRGVVTKLDLVDFLTRAPAT